MEITIKRNQLRRLAGVFYGLLPRQDKTVLPILSHVLLDAKGEGIYVTGTDLDTWATLRIEGEVEAAGTLAVPMRQLRDISRVLPAGDVRLWTGTRQSEGTLVHTVVLQSGEARFEIECIHADEFPQAPELVDTVEISVPARDAFRLYDAVGFAVNKDEWRPILNGVLWETEAGVIRFCATNGHRLAVMEAPVDGIDPMPEMIIRPAALRAAQKVFSTTASVRVSRSETCVSFTVDGERIVSRMIEGPYPNFRNVVPTVTRHAATFNRSALQRAVERAAVLAPKETRRITLFLGETDASEGWLSTRSVEGGRYGERIELSEPVEGGAITVSMNCRYALEVLRHVKASEVRIRLTDPNHAILWQPIGEEASPLTLLLMPLRNMDDGQYFPWSESAERKVA